MTAFPLVKGGRRAEGARGDFARSIWLALVALLAASSALARTSAKCIVIDPELQGSYVGGCRDGKAEGRGTAKGSAEYSGEFHEGMKHGRGVKTWPWGDRYDGDFANDAKQGMGIYTWGKDTPYAGDWYEGEFANDRRNGFGVYVWASGDSYAGPWKDDAVAGRATSMMASRYRATQASLAAMQKPGVKLCREWNVGIGLTERIEGVTAGVNAATLQVAVTVRQVGQTPLAIAGVEVKPGDTVWDDPLNWIPCN